MFLILLFLYNNGNIVSGLCKAHDLNFIWFSLLQISSQIVKERHKIKVNHGVCSLLLKQHLWDAQNSSAFDSNTTLVS